MLNKIDWINDRINIKQMGRNWTITNWCFIVVGIILGVFNLVGSSVFHLPAIYMFTTGFVFILAFIVYAMVILVVFNRKKKDEPRQEARPISPVERWIYIFLFLGLSIWLSITAYNLFSVLFLENNPPLSAVGYIIPMIFLILCAMAPFVLIYLVAKHLLPIKEK